MTKSTGYISVYHTNRGYGFIHETLPSKKLVIYFFHINSVVSGDPRDGMPVRFVPSANQKGSMAIDVEVGGAE